MLCASPAYLDRFGTPRNPGDLPKHRFVAFRDPSPRTLIDANGERAPFDPRQTAYRLILDDGATQKTVTLGGIGISINSLWSVHRELRDGSLVRLLPNHRVDDRTALWLVYPKSNVLTVKVRVLIDYLREKIGRPPVWERT